jgi:hypothetical protein
MLIERAPMFFTTVYVPGYLGGLLLCALHGHFEHAGGTISYYGRVYNVLLFNDGYHVEHHANPCVPWSRLPARRDPRARASAWPAPLRWVERGVDRLLEALERLVLRSPMLQRSTCLRARAAESIAGLPRLRHRHRRRRIIRGPRDPPVAGPGGSSRSDRVARTSTAPAPVASGVTFVHAIPGSHCGNHHRDMSDGVDAYPAPTSSSSALLLEGDREAIYGKPPAQRHRPRLDLAQARRQPRRLRRAAEARQPADWSGGCLTRLTPASDAGV